LGHFLRPAHTAAGRPSDAAHSSSGWPRRLTSPEHRLEDARELLVGADLLGQVLAGRTPDLVDWPNDICTRDAPPRQKAARLGINNRTSATVRPGRRTL
jgi:hypothetical protein